MRQARPCELLSVESSLTSLKCWMKRGPETPNTCVDSNGSDRSWYLVFAARAAPSTNACLRCISNPCTRSIWYWVETLLIVYPLLLQFLHSIVQHSHRLIEVHFAARPQRLQNCAKWQPICLTRPNAPNSPKCALLIYHVLQAPWSVLFTYLEP